MTGRTEKPRRSEESGNAMLEMGLVFVPLFAIIFAISDYSMAIFTRATLQQSVREGVRYAVTYQTMSGLCQDASIKQVVKTASSGFLTSTNDAIIFVKYHAPTDLTTVVTGSESNAAGNIVEVSVEGYNYRWMAPIMRSNTPLIITVTAADRTESLPGTATPPCR